MRKVFYLLHFALFSSVLGAEDISPKSSSSLASTESFASSIVNGSVCAITGNFVDRELDLFIPGPTPIVLQRYYQSSNTFSGHLYKSWQLSEPTELVANEKIGWDKSHLFATLTTAH